MSTIESVLKETRSFAPIDAFRQNATLSGMEAYNTVCERANNDYEGFWADLARELLSWHKPFTRTF
ncbi:acetyl-CoA synthetase-like protein, partial [Microvirgula sp. AG722]